MSVEKFESTDLKTNKRREFLICDEVPVLGNETGNRFHTF